ncbi:patatin-like phospholipase family protein [Faecalibacter sp. LW9]|uniref:patatin-like phospholipase family protein n=1 Tax=Faecalibacter sp. LW9 TaxID=3103144 RepID=UPI002AFFA98B|nr:patatin-like phospholipase family protein [Faecalibacter sp. LW9]
MNNPVFGIALSGGGHRGLAHVGILQFLDEQKISPQILSGTSAGAIVASMYAIGKTPLEILELFQSISFFNWNYLTTKKAGLFDIERLEIYLDRELGDRTIGELNKDVYISATDMQRGRLKIFNRDTMAKKAILASCAFPAVFSPVVIDGITYSDGGMLNNFPVTTIQGHCDYLIGSNVNPVVETSANNLKSIKSITLRSFEIMMNNNAHQHKNLCDWYLEPADLAKYFTFETSKSKMKEIYDIGYLEAKSNFSTFEDLLKIKK